MLKEDLIDYVLEPPRFFWDSLMTYPRWPFAVTTWIVLDFIASFFETRPPTQCLPNLASSSGLRIASNPNTPAVVEFSTRDHIGQLKRTIIVDDQLHIITLPKLANVRMTAFSCPEHLVKQQVALLRGPVSTEQAATLQIIGAPSLLP